MDTYELSHDQMEELKQRYLCDKSGSVSWYELANADALISDGIIHIEYAGVVFFNDDFFCTCGKE